jgi:hypothetical protein
LFVFKETQQHSTKKATKTRRQVIKNKKVIRKKSETAVKQKAQKNAASAGQN